MLSPFVASLSRDVDAFSAALELPWTTSPVEGQIRRLKMLTRTMQADLDIWIASYNEQRAHQGRWCYGKTPMQTFVDTTPLAREKMLNAA